ncbi:MAG: hypothetical protein LBR86_01350 [Tannerella sp.]|jgi:hypothetical protein|nr:hypothetical protein [Tannerella sp.]
MEYRFGGLTRRQRTVFQQETQTVSGLFDAGLGVPEASLGVPGASLGVPGASLGVPGTSLGVPGMNPGRPGYRLRERLPKGCVSERVADAGHALERVYAAVIIMYTGNAFKVSAERGGAVTKNKGYLYVKICMGGGVFFNNTEEAASETPVTRAPAVAICIENRSLLFSSVNFISLKSIQIYCYKNSGKDKDSPQYSTNCTEILYKRAGFMYKKN